MDLEVTGWSCEVTAASWRGAGSGGIGLGLGRGEGREEKRGELLRCRAPRGVL